MTIDEEVDRLIDERPGKELLIPRYDDPAHRSPSSCSDRAAPPRRTVSLTDDPGSSSTRAWATRRRITSGCSTQIRRGPTPYIMTTQAHVDHLGGVQLFREPGTVYVAQANNAVCQRDDARIRQLRMRTAGIWFDMTGRDAARIAAENPGVSMHQDEPTPDLAFEDRLDLAVDGLQLELIAAVGETIDSMIVWLPEHRLP